MLQAQTQQSANVLFVDDEPRVLTSMRAMFRRDYNVLLANSGQEALEILRNQPIDVIVSDQRMPGMTGIEVLNQVKQIAPSAVRILLTGYADLDAIEASINESEVFRYLTKPCPQDELKEVVKLAAEASLQNDRTSGDETGDAATLKSPLSLVEPGAQQVSGNSDVRSQIESLNDLPNTAEAARERSDSLQSALANQLDENVELLLLSRDTQLISALEQALKGGRKLHTVNSLESAIEILERFPVGVLVTDTAIDEDAIQNLTAELKRHVPQLVTIIASDRSDAQTLISLINYGQIFRFLLKPIQGGQCRIWIQSAVKKHLELVSLPGAERYHQVAEHSDNHLESGGLISKLRSGILNISRRLALRGQTGTDSGSD